MVSVGEYKFRKWCSNHGHVEFDELHCFRGLEVVFI